MHFLAAICQYKAAAIEDCEFALGRAPRLSLRWADDNPPLRGDAPDAPPCPDPGQSWRRDDADRLRHAAGRLGAGDRAARPAGILEPAEGFRFLYRRRPVQARPGILSASAEAEARADLERRLQHLRPRSRRSRSA